MSQPTLAQYDLLSHPFYQAWQAGKLTLSALQYYATQYSHHVDAFPRYLGRIHSQCLSGADRQVILRNLMDEEGISGVPHPELWRQFANGVGVNDAEFTTTPPSAATQALVDTFFKLANTSYAAGLGALYAYEQQVPEIAKTKIQGLKAFYGINDEKTLQFFTVHQQADEWHSQEIRDLINALPVQQQEEAHAASLEAAQALWNFLSGVYEATMGSMDHASCATGQCH